MNKSGKNQKGFSAVEALAILVVLTLIVIVGYMVYKSTHHKATVAPATASSSVKAVQKEFQFKELGVEFILPDSLKDLSYTVQKLPDGAGGVASVLYLDDPQLNTLLNECNAADGQPSSTEAPNFASLSRTEGKYNATQEMGESGLLEQFSTFHIMVGYPNGAICGSSNQSLNDSWNAALSKDQTDFVKAFKATAKEIKS